MSINPRGQKFAVYVKVGPKDNPTGKPVRYRASAETEREAVKLEAQARAGIMLTGSYQRPAGQNANPQAPAQQARLADAKSRTLRACLTKAWEHPTHGWKHGKRGKQSLSDATRCAELLGLDTLCQDVTRQSFEKLLRELKTDRRSDDTCHRLCQSFYRALSFAEREGWIAARPRWDRPRAGRSREFTFSPAVEAQVLDYFDKTESDDQMRDIFTIGIDLGLRLSNILKMDAAWIDLERRFLTVPYASMKANETAVIVLWSQRVNAILKSRMEHHQHEASGRIFTMGPKAVQRRMNACRDSLGYTSERDWCFHATRHTAASRYLEKRIPFKYVMDQMHHKVAKTTQRYAHMKPDARLKAFTELMQEARSS